MASGLRLYDLNLSQSLYCQCAINFQLNRKERYFTLNICISFSDKPKNVTLKIARTNVCIESAVTFKCEARANPEVEYYQLYENSVQIANESKYGVWNKRMSKEGEFSYACEAKNLIGIWKSSSVNVTVSGKSCR